MDIIQVIEADHRHIEQLFSRFERTGEGDQDLQRRLVQRILREVSVHAAAEEEVVYPALSRMGLDTERLDALEDHHAAKVALSEIEAMSPRQERFGAKVRQMVKSVRRHLEEEEANVLPRLREQLDEGALRQLAGEFATLRRSAPTRPHPAAPDTPPANVIANAGAALMDRLLDGIDDARQLVRSLAQQLAERGLRAGRLAASRIGSSSRSLVEQAQARGERAMRQARVLGSEVVEGAAEQGMRVADEIEHRTVPAAREVSGGLRRAAARTRRASERDGKQAARRRSPREHSRRRRG